MKTQLQVFFKKTTLKLQPPEEERVDEDPGADSNVDHTTITIYEHTT
jgi:hypothetical protein